MSAARARAWGRVVRAGWVVVGLGLAAWVQGRLWPLGGSVGPLGVASVGGFLAGASGTEPVSCEDAGRPGRAWPRWRLGRASRFEMSPSSRWRPSTGEATITSPRGVSALRVWWVPAWWVPTAGMLAAGVGIVMGRRRVAGECRACGYSRVGLGAGAACPECGAGAVENAKEARC